ncbi:MAG: DUF721 domain-containing protein [Candidatus Cryptobacteroides sp.]
MMENRGRMSRKEAVGMEELIGQYIKSMKLSSGLNRQRVFAAWNDVSGAARYTVSLFFRNGVLYCTMNSSVVRNRLYFMKEDILKLMNDRLASDELFTPEGKDGGYVKDIVLK